jgi:Rrf2 family protein
MLSALAMITRTTISAIRALLFVSQNRNDGFLSPRRIGEALGESPTYLAKVTRSLVKSGILRAEKGVKGGVWLARSPEQITLLAVVEACQGTILGNYCQDGCRKDLVCGYHRAAEELREGIVGVLSNWTLAQMLRKPHGAPGTGAIPCLFQGVESARRAASTAKTRRS